MKTVVVHCKKSSYDIYIGRPSKWGNPFTHKQGTQAQTVVPTVEEAIKRYEEWVRQQPELMASLHEIKGKVIACWCKPGPCHGDVLAKLADEVE